MTTYLCLSSVRAIVQLKKELARPGTQESRVGLKFRKEKIWTGHLNPDELNIQIFLFLIRARLAVLSVNRHHWTHSCQFCHSGMTRLEEKGCLFLFFTWTHGAGSDLGRPSESCTRCKRSSMTWVGPPPPSPKPNSTALWFARPLSLLFLRVLISCGIQWEEWITLTTRGNHHQ